MSNSISFNPYTKDKVIQSVLNKLQDEYPKYHLAGLYISGSRLNRLNTHDSDFDFYAFIQVRDIDLLTGRVLAKDLSLDLGQNNGVAYKADIKVYDQRQLYKMLSKSNPSTIELFAEAPIYLDMTYGELYVSLSETNNRQYLQDANPQAFINAVGGMLNSERYQLLKQKKRSLKDLSLMAKYLDYLDSFVHDTLINVDMRNNTNSLPRKLRHLYDNDELSYGEAINYLQKMEANYHSLKNKFSEKLEKENTAMTAKTKKAQQFLKDYFIASL